MKVLSLFSGVGGFDLGLERAGMETMFQCEWDKHATKILERHWPDVPRWDDVSTLTGEHILRHAPVIDVVAWGSPCQDLSVAGKRAGLEGARSGLFHQGVRIIKELRELTNGKYPRISVWENVAGALSSGAGADFGQVLTEMDEAGACFSEWRILDAQYFGVPQRRRRVFLISVFDPATAARCPDPLLPVSESVRRDTQESATTGQEPASETATGIGDGGEPPILIDRAAFNQGQNAAYEPSISDSPVVPSLVARGPHAVFTKGKRAQSPTDDETWDENRPAPTLNQFDQGDTRVTTIIVQEPMLAFDTQFGSNANVFEEQSPTLKASQQSPSVAYPIQDGREIEKHQNGIGVADEGSPAYTLDQTGAQAVAYGIQGNVIRRQDHNEPGGKGHTDDGDPMFTLTSTDVHAIAFQPGTMIRMSGGVWDELAPTLRAEAKRGDNEPHVIQYDGYNQKIHVDEPSVTLRIGRDSSDFVAQPVEAAGFKAGQGADAGGIGYQEGTSQTLTSQMNGIEPTVLTPTMAVRRLTPLECERLMGWPDDWTAGQSDTHRYKQCGNGVASPVATWIGQQLMELDQ